MSELEEISTLMKSIDDEAKFMMDKTGKIETVMKMLVMISEMSAAVGKLSRRMEALESSHATTPDAQQEAESPSTYDTSMSWVGKE